MNFLKDTVGFLRSVSGEHINLQVVYLFVVGSVFGIAGRGIEPDGNFLAASVHGLYKVWGHVIYLQVSSTALV